MRANWLGLLFILAACGREAPPETVALGYARALYARDLPQAYRLVSAQDRRWKDEATFVAERGAVTDFALEVSRQLASFIETASVERTVTHDHAEVKLKLRLPNANAPELARIAREWDEAALNALSESERETIRRALDRLHGDGTLPMLEGDETFRLVREAVGWRLVFHWAEAIRIRLRTRIPEGLPLRAIPEEQELLVKPGEQFQMTVRLTNRSGQDLSLRVAHEIEPEAAASSLVFVQCPLLLPVRLLPKETREVSTSLMLVGDPPDRTKRFQVTYAFRTVK